VSTRRSRFTFTIAMVVLLAALGPPVARAAPGSKRREALRAEVRGAKPALAAQTRLEDYHASELHPSRIVERIHALESTTAWDELCAELGALPDDELELFEDEVRKPEHARRMRCAPALLARVDAYWKAAARQLAAAHPAPAALPRLTSVPVQVDVSKDDVFTDGRLAAGEVAITFDDGPHATRTPRVLEILRAAGVRATFFEIGRNAAARPDVAREVIAAGHVIGSHTFSHANVPKVGEPHAENEIESGDASVSLALGLRPGQVPFFRFPYGAKTPMAQAFVRDQGKTTFFWNMDSRDWQIRDPHKLFLNVLAELDRAGRGIILFHDIHEQTVIVLPHVLQELAERHIKTVVFVPTGEPTFKEAEKETAAHR
jgi:peptidoglycan/xylan/chitin deacetylase (PgdA/CDA1 family)